MKIGKNLPAAPQPRLVDAPVKPAEDAAVAASVAGAPTTAAAWDALGGRPPTETAPARERAREAEALSRELRRLWVAVEKGRALVDAGKPVTPAVLARFTELHLQRLELRWKLETAVFPRTHSPTRLAALADEEAHAVRAATKTREACFPSEGAQRGMHGLNAAVAKGDAAAVQTWCRAAVEIACHETYTARDNTTEGAE